jgi:hypothetical protein
MDLEMLGSRRNLNIVVRVSGREGFECVPCLDSLGRTAVGSVLRLCGSARLAHDDGAEKLFIAIREIDTRQAGRQEEEEEGRPECEKVKKLS